MQPHNKPDCVLFLKNAMSLGGGFDLKPSKAGNPAHVVLAGEQLHLLHGPGFELDSSVHETM